MCSRPWGRQSRKRCRVSCGSNAMLPGACRCAWVGHGAATVALHCVEHMMYDLRVQTLFELRERAGRAEIWQHLHSGPTCPLPCLPHGFRPALLGAPRRRRPHDHHQHGAAGPHAVGGA